MPTEGTENPSLMPSLLSSEEPSSFCVRNPESTTPILLVCDHASRRIPQSLGKMGLDAAAQRCHLAWDIGAGALTERLAVMLGVSAVVCQYSRLVVDCNRQLMDPGAFLEFGDGVVVHGNRNLREHDKQARASEIYWPYHNAIEAQIKRFKQLGTQPALVSIHSFTPVMNALARPWEIGVLWDRDRITAEIFIHDFRKAGLNVGDNEPYSGKALQDFTIDYHAESAEIPHVGIEIRQDFIHEDSGVEKIAGIMNATIESLQARIRQADVARRQPGQTGE